MICMRRPQIGDGEGKKKENGSGCQNLDLGRREVPMDDLGSSLVVEGVVRLTNDVTG